MGYIQYSMSNDEDKTSLVNYCSFYFDQSTINNTYCNSNSNNNIPYQTVFPLKLSDKHSAESIATPSFKKPAYQTDGFNGKRYNNNTSTHNKDERVIDSQFVPMNLITNTGLDLSHSIGKPTFETYFNRELLIHNNNNNNYYSYTSSPSSSTSPSIDVENDDKSDFAYRIMSPVSIPPHIQNPLLKDTRNPNQSAFTNMELTAGAIPSGFPVHYQQLYANNAALYGAPVMFSGAIHAAHASYMAGLPLHATLSPNDTYLKAIQAAACGIYSPTALAPPPLPPSTTSSCKPSSLHSPTASSMMALTPSTQPGCISKSPHHQQKQYSPNIVNNLAEIEQQQQKKKDYLVTPVISKTTLRTCGTSNSTGTYLNNKVNERLTGVAATKDSHFKVPNGKEGSLKHRILRPSSNNDVPADQVKNPVMRNYSTTTSFKKGNYIELANGTLRRVEDMRTEDFIQCAERSPHHQLAESTVVKINTSLSTTAVITFSYDRNRSKVDMEVSLDHPFFVYGQGWASCNPEMSMKMFGLKCQRLQVGDICISLTKREQPTQTTPPIPQTTQNISLSQSNEGISYQARPSLTVSSPNAAHLKSPSLPTICSTTEMPYSAPLNAHSFSIPVPQPTHHLPQQQHQQQHHHHQVQQQAYAEMAKLMSSYAYAKGMPQLPHEQLKDVLMDATMLQNLPPKMMTAFYQNQIYQLAQQQQHQEHLRQTEMKNNQQRVPNSNFNVTSILNTNVSPQPAPANLENNHIQEQPPQTQPLDVTMSRKRRWSAPENMFDDDESDTQPRRNRSSPAAART